MAQINKLVCDSEECGKEIVPELGAKAIALVAIMGNKPKDFCSVRCAKRYLTALDMDAESEKIKAMAAEHEAAQKAIAEAGIDPNKVDHIEFPK